MHILRKNSGHLKILDQSYHEKNTPLPPPQKKKKIKKN